MATIGEETDDPYCLNEDVKIVAAGLQGGGKADSGSETKSLAEAASQHGIQQKTPEHMPIAADGETPLPDRLRPMTSVGNEDAQSMVSELTLQTNRSLFRESLYPSGVISVASGEGPPGESGAADHIEQGFVQITSDYFQVTRRETSRSNVDGRANSRSASAIGEISSSTTLPLDPQPGAFPFFPNGTPENHEPTYERSDQDRDMDRYTDAERQIDHPLEAEIVPSEESDRDDEEEAAYEVVVTQIAEPMDREPSTVHRRGKGFAMMLGFFLALMGIVVVGILFGLRKRATRLTQDLALAAPSPAYSTTTSPTPSPTVDPTEAAEVEFLITMLPDFTQEAISSDATSPQAKAWEWLKQDPFLHTNQLHRTVQRYSLATFFYATLGDKWAHQDYWLNHTMSECGAWAMTPANIAERKVACDYQQRVSLIAFAQNSLRGTLPPEVALLSDLTHIYIWQNQIGGSIPSELGLLSKLTLLQLGENTLQGSLPAELLSLSELENLELDNNAIVGTIPTKIGLLSKLRRLNLFSNRFTGSLPNDLKMLRSLQELSVHDNQLEGTLPPSLLAVDSLKELSFDGNRFSGHMPSEVGLLTQLRVLRMSRTELTGKIPTQLGQLRRVELIDLSDNNFSPSMLSSDLFLLPLLQEFYCTNCQFTGTLPAQAWNSHLQVLHLQENGLHGQMKVPQTAASIRELRLGGNNLSGTLPQGLGGMRSLQHLDLSENGGIGGTLPSELGLLQRIRILKLNDNAFEGSIPKEVFELRNLKEISLDGNGALNGNATEFCNLHSSWDVLTVDCAAVICPCCGCPKMEG